MKTQIGFRRTLAASLILLALAEGLSHFCRRLLYTFRVISGLFEHQFLGGTRTYNQDQIQERHCHCTVRQKVEMLANKKTLKTL